jgi:hypothetical protein
MAHLDTPHKARVLGALQYAKVIEKRHGIRVSRRDIGKVFGCHHTTVCRLEAATASPADSLVDGPVDSPADSPANSLPDSLPDSLLDSPTLPPADWAGRDFLRMRNHNPSLVETRGQKPLLSKDDCQKIEAMYEEHGYEARSMTWEAQCLNATDKDVSSRTVRRAMRLHLNYSKYVAAVKGFVKPEVAEARMTYARKMLEQWDQDDWRRVRYSDETHFGWVLSRSKLPRAYVSRKPGQRERSDCVAEQPPSPDTVDEHRVHVWAAVGHDFKSPLVQYYGNPKVSTIGSLTANVIANL